MEVTDAVKILETERIIKCDNDCENCRDCYVARQQEALDVLIGYVKKNYGKTQM